MIAITKTHIPQVRHALVVRPELLRLLDEGMRAKLTLVSAPSGYGKSTALSQWALQRGTLVAWVSLDKQDDDWTLFWKAAVESLRNRADGFGGTVMPLLAEGPSSSSVSREPAMTALLNELERLPGELAIVFDDFHLITLPAIHQSMNYLIERLPDSIHLYIASRNDLSFPTSKWFTEGKLRRITTEQLRFRQEEAAEFFLETTELRLTAEQLDQLYDQTEGWITGLRLAALSMERSGDAARSIRRFSGHQQHIADYLLQEVYRDLPEAIRDFLLQTCVLSQMNYALCEAVTGQAGAQRQLEQLEQLQLFIVPLDEQREWYRYHHLLADFLQTMLARNAPGLWERANVRAAQWFEHQGFVEEAAEHYLAGRQYEAVVRLIEAHMNELLSRGRNVAIARWAMQVPEPYFSDRPLVELFYLYAMVGIRQFDVVPDRAERLRIRFEALADGMDKESWRNMMGEIYYICATAAYIGKDLAGAADYFIRGDAHARENSFFLQGGNNKHFSVGEFDDHLSYVNDYDGAARFLTRMMDHWRDYENHPFATPMYASYAKLLYEWNRLDEAEAWINRIMQATRFAPTASNRYQLVLAASRIQQAKGNGREAASMLERLKLMIDSPDYAIFMRKIEAEQASLAVRQGDLASARAWMAACGLSHEDEAALGQVSEQLAFVRVLAADGRLDPAMSLGERLYRLLTKEDRLRDCVHVLIVLSLTLHKAGRREEALEKLEIALRLAEPQGFIRSFADEGPALAELLLTIGESPAAEARYARQVLRTFTSEHSPRRTKIHCFGRLRVETDGGETIKWRTSKTEELMALLLHHRGETASRERILDALWPEVDVERAGAQFHTTTHYLRKALQRIGLEGLVQHAKGGYRIETSRLDCDLDEWERLRASAVQAEDNAADQEAAELIALYGEGYLAGHAYAWAEPTRNRIEGEFVGVLIRLQEREEKRGRYDAAAEFVRQALAHDPLNERLYERLIRMLVLADDRISAVKQYEALRTMLRSEFGMEPREAVGKLLERV
ncbi:BTAD domain-containing putative transcriptional regulator [Paenibacillus sacheonensis]|uniref:OmpR/PhoB-type domain-containing protein n=1 Tax=Paenibacillus sacheonensis TaxID=742054 RepID=A0A7X4YSJ2_9BACL|nr:BTAD domain-containing putative transcriptional regulator [Paenibacillus sacheonensis]MBM7567883.1 LuxR family maltose regulon positive regulatory protein [Paenibacillus sacheonensis]NBC70769.1 hypothetical protein [Paenibacillus sacheonensis]